MLQTASEDTKKANARRNSQPKAAPAGMLAPPVPALSNQASLRLQRKCDCGGAPDCDCDMGHDKKKKEKDSPRTALHRKPSGGALPASTLLDPEIQSFFEARLQRKELRPAAPPSSGPPIQIGAVSDPLEAEADRVADQVMRMPDPVTTSFGNPPVVRRKCAACGKEDAHKLQKKKIDGQAEAGGEAPPIVHEVLRSPGQPLDTASRSFFEPRFGVDFSRVRVHSDASAAQSARAVNALAYTVGQDIVSGVGQYHPESNAGKHLLAHELTHVVQQRGSTTAIQRLTQDLPYVGAAQAYLNPLNQAARLFLPALSPAQKSLLDGIFGASLATSIIRLNQNSILAAGSCYRTTGNIINMPGTTIDDDHLIHEAAHVWQHQNTLYGVGYAVSALRAMAFAQVLGGDWEKAYDYTKVEKYHIPWRYWNAEQQAHWIQDHRCLPTGWMLEGPLPDLPGAPPKDQIESAGL